MLSGDDDDTGPSSSQQQEVQPHTFEQLLQISQACHSILPAFQEPHPIYLHAPDYLEEVC